MKALLFDLDGVLVDVSRSYREAIKKTVRTFTKARMKNSEVQAYKNRGGFNNDWDLALAVLKDRGASISRPEVVKVFQGYYLGNDFDGLIKNETWLLDPAVLDELAGKYGLGIVTGRPAVETSYTLRRFKVLEFFPVAVTLDDLPPGRAKPDPWGLRRALAGLHMQEGYYAGDNVDDMEAAVRAGLVPLGIARPGGSGSCPESMLLAHGAWQVLRDINRIKEVLA
jgi:HAD superfamily hydrolase (TIGR01548 family)